MVRLDQIKRIYMIGIGGIGMSALARYFFFHGRTVSGYDKTETGLTRALNGEGIPVVFDDREDLAPQDADLVVYTPAIPESHRQLSFYRRHGYPVLKRSEVLGLITGSSFNICIAGTHGKTTVSTMVAHILRHSGYGCNAFLGGIAVNYDSNFWNSERETCVVEADEYDRSFLRLSPNIAAITAMDADHLDIYGTEKAMQDAFIEFAARIKPDGILFLKKGLRREKEFRAATIRQYAVHDPGADVHVTNLKLAAGAYTFDVQDGNVTVEEVVLNMGGLHNVENATVAIAIARYLGIRDEAIKAAVAAFRGVKRRFEFIIRSSGMVFIDDYAHHPEELEALIGGAKKMFGGLKCTVIFQPHLYTRTRDLAPEFAKSLDTADEVILLPLYPAREQPIEGVNSEMIAAGMQPGRVKVMSREELLNEIEERVAAGRARGLWITAGAGNIDAMVEPIRKLLAQGQA